MSNQEDKAYQRDVVTSMRKARQQVKNSRKPKRPRRRSWMPDRLDDLYDIDYPQGERVVPRGERERRQIVQAAALAALENETSPPDDVETSPIEETSGQRGTVVEMSTNLCRVILNGRSLVCSVRGTLSAEGTGFTNVIAVGDQVIVSENGVEQGVVEEILPRKSILARPDVFQDGYRTRDRHLQQIIAANVDQVLIVASWRAPHLWPALVDRYLIAAQRNGLLPIICVNKIDLAEEPAEYRAALQPYIDLGYRVIFSSVVSGAGIDELKRVLREKTTVLAGMSGVGKSSLLNAIQPGLQIHTQVVSDHSYEGRHTTTTTSMLELEMGGFVVDTPGIRQFGLSGLRRADLIHFYPDIAAVAEGCRFGDCSHTHEPGCAVKAAVAEGCLSETRYHNYQYNYDDLPD